MSTENKLVKTVTDSAVVIGLSAGVGYVAKKMMKESFLSGSIHRVLQITQNGLWYYPEACILKHI